MTWLEDYTDLLCDLDQIQSRWREVLAGVPLNDKAALEEAWRLAGRDGKAPDPGASFAAAKSIMPELRHAADVAQPFLRQTLAAVHGGLHRLERPVVLPLDFAGRLIQVARNGAIFTLGEADALAADHPLVVAVPKESTFLQDGMRCFVLGESILPREGGRFPADYYDLQSVITLTTQWSSQQKAQLAAYATDILAKQAASEARRLSR